MHRPPGPGDAPPALDRVAGTDRAEAGRLIEVSELPAGWREWAAARH